jgi:glycerol-3-phosphate acyltransferase PlsY
MTLLLTIIAAYLIGAIPCGLVLAKLAGFGDIRQTGSGNIGATNVYRTAGRSLGLLTLVGDALKGLLPALAAQLWLGYAGWALAAVVLAAFLGHCFPVYLGFKGGKGVATALGIFLVLSPLAVAGAFLLFALMVAKWRYISLGSISAAAIMPVLIWTAGRSLPIILATTVIAGLVVWRHQANIDRLLAGTETRFKF